MKRQLWSLRSRCEHSTFLCVRSQTPRRAERYTAAHSPFHSARSVESRTPTTFPLPDNNTCLAKLRPTFLLNGSLRTRTKSCKLIKCRWDWSVPQLKVDWTSFLQRPKKCNCAWWKEKQIMLSCWFSIFLLIGYEMLISVLLIGFNWLFLCDISIGNVTWNLLRRNQNKLLSFITKLTIRAY